MQKRKGKTRVTIVRPSIVIGAYKDPMVGWTETLSAGGALVYAIQIGIIKLIQCNP